MNKNAQFKLIQYRIEKAKETYQEALLMQRENHWNTCANRLYYSCFYAVTALLEKDGFISSKHSGVKSLFNQHIVKTGKISKEKGKLYNRLFDARQEGDYLDFVYFKSDDVTPWILAVKDFIDNISKIIEMVEP